MLSDIPIQINYIVKKSLTHAGVPLSKASLRRGSQAEQSWKPGWRPCLNVSCDLKALQLFWTDLNLWGHKCRRRRIAWHMKKTLIESMTSVLAPEKSLTRSWSDSLIKLGIVNWAQCWGVTKPLKSPRKLRLCCLPTCVQFVRIRRWRSTQNGRNGCDAVDLKYGKSCQGAILSFNCKEQQDAKCEEAAECPPFVFRFSRYVPVSSLTLAVLFFVEGKWVMVSAGVSFWVMMSGMCD